MKKLHSSVLAFVLLLLSVSAGAAPISASNANGYHGDQVSVDVSLQSDDFSLGGNFWIGFDGSKLSLTDIQDPTGVFSPVYALSSNPIEKSLAELSLACLSTCSDTFSGSVFSLKFTITGSYPDVIPVSIDWFDPYGFEEGNYKGSVTPTVTVLASNGGSVPEPGALGLVGLALLLLSLGGRRHWVRNDRV